MSTSVLALSVAALLGSVLQPAVGPPPDEAAAMRFEPFPGVVVDRALGRIELSGFVPVDAHSDETPTVWIEVVAESGGVRDHEALVALDAEPEQVHAALLLLGLEPGTPGLIRDTGERTEPEGPEVTVRVRIEGDDGAGEEQDPLEWVIAEETGERLSARSPRFVFGGSSEQTFAGGTVYMARAEGVVVGLSTFGVGTDEGDRGVETVGMIPVLSPDTGTGDPLWLADPGRVPEFGTRVTLLISAAG
ncbi:MAG: YdjY domain-containing protein [Phycisphaerales bacterium]